LVFLAEIPFLVSALILDDGFPRTLDYRWLASDSREFQCSQATFFLDAANELGF
jgi:hypothetical protein